LLSLSLILTKISICLYAVYDVYDCHSFLFLLLLFRSLTGSAHHSQGALKVSLGSGAWLGMGIPNGRNWKMEGIHLSNRMAGVTHSFRNEYDSREIKNETHSTIAFEVERNRGDGRKYNSFDIAIST
jgi:hypothetical protein